MYFVLLFYIRMFADFRTSTSGSWFAEYIGSADRPTDYINFLHGAGIILTSD